MNVISFFSIAGKSLMCRIISSVAEKAGEKTLFGKRYNNYNTLISDRIIVNVQTLHPLQLTYKISYLHAGSNQSSSTRTNCVLDTPRRCTCLCRTQE